MSETCADCGLPFDGLRPAGYVQASQRYHFGCGDPFGTKAREAEITKLKSQLEEAQIKDATEIERLQAALQEAKADHRTAIDHLLNRTHLVNRKTEEIERLRSQLEEARAVIGVMSDAIDVADRYISNSLADEKRGALAGMKKNWETAIRKVASANALNGSAK